MIYLLIKELNLNEKEVYKMNYVSSLNWLSFLKNKHEVETNKQKQK